MPNPVNSSWAVRSCSRASSRRRSRRSHSPYRRWPGTRLKAPLSGFLNTVLVFAGGVVLTFIGQLVVGHGNLRGIFDATPGPNSSPTFPATMPLAGAFFVLMLQLTL